MAELLQPLRKGIDVTHRRIVHPLLTSGKANHDREIAHERALNAIEWMQEHEFSTNIAEKLFPYKSRLLRTDVVYLQAQNPLGIAAGFDKNGRVHRFLGNGLGFGAVTVGSVTSVPYVGNDRPRIFDLPNNDAVINRMGFPGDGTAKVAQRLEETKHQAKNYLLFVNIAASKPSFDNDTALDDYASAAEEMIRYGDAHEVNVSSPNTPGVRGLQEPDVFHALAQRLEPIYKHNQKLLFYKFSPDLEQDKLKENIKTALDHGAKGISITNTTIDLAIRKGLIFDDNMSQAGGISGKPLGEKALDVSRFVYDEFGDGVVIKRAGGVRTGEDVWNAIQYGGATLVDVYTAFVRPTTSTPNFAGNILRNFTKAMEFYNMTSMNDFKQTRDNPLAYPLKS